MFESLTKFIPLIEKAGSFGDWVIDQDHAGTMDDPIQMPYVDFSSLVIEVGDAAPIPKCSSQATAIY